MASEDVLQGSIRHDADAGKTSEIIYPEGILTPQGPRPLPLPQTLIAGFQHVIAMFGATVLAPLLMGFDPNVTIFFSGCATLLFWALVRGRVDHNGLSVSFHVPSYLGSSFSFIAAVIVATGYTGNGPNQNIPLALGGIMAAGAIYFLIGATVQKAGYAWIARLMPPVVTGAIVAIIGLNLAKVAVNQISGSSFNTVMGLLTIIFVAIPAVFAPHFFRRLPFLIGGVLSYFLYLILCNGFEFGTPIDFSAVGSASWIGLPNFQMPTFDSRAISLIAPVAVVLVAENLGHIKAIGAMIHRPLDAYLGRAFMADGLSTFFSGACGGTGVTTYAENMGVMGVTKNYYSGAFVAAGCFAILIGLSPKVGAIIHTIPVPVLGGLSFVMFGLITATAARIWVQNNVDFEQPRNLIVVGVSVVMGAGDLTVSIGEFALGGITTATFTAIVLYRALQDPRDRW